MTQDWKHIWRMLREFPGGRSFEEDYLWLKEQIKNAFSEATCAA